jgi:glucose-6-phosphate 1-epimerase
LDVLPELELRAKVSSVEPAGVERAQLEPAGGARRLRDTSWRTRSRCRRDWFAEWGWANHATQIYATCGVQQHRTRWIVKRDTDAIANAADLDRRFGVRGAAEVCESNGGLPKVQITSSFGDGEMYLHGAQVTSWKPADSNEVLFLSSKSRWEEGQAIRGGIPICFPWFRAKANDPRAPAHGFVRTKMWQIESVVENQGGVAVTMSTQSDDQTRRWWPGEFRLMHRVTFGRDLSLELVCTNTGRTPLRFEEALHTYNRVGDVRQVRLRGLKSARFLDNTDLNREKTQRDDLAIASQTDNAYLNTEDAVDLVDMKMQRRIRLGKANSLSTVVWNPWREGAAGLQDLGDGEWTQFLCVEASNILDAAIHLAPGQEHRMTAVVSVEKL